MINLFNKASTKSIQCVLHAIKTAPSFIKSHTTLAIGILHISTLKSMTSTYIERTKQLKRRIKNTRACILKMDCKRALLSKEPISKPVFERLLFKHSALFDTAKLLNSPPPN